MNISVVDAIIVLAVLLGAVVGFKQGGIKRTVHLVGLVLVIVLSFILKDVLASWLYKYLPFFTFGSLLGELPIINVLFYQIISFTIVFIILNSILKILLMVTGVIEKVLKATIILSIPSKILGIFVGALEAYIYLYIVLFFFSLPVFDIDIINESKYKNVILNNTPIISSLSENTMNVYNGLDEIINDGKVNSKDANDKALKLMLDNNIISIDNTKTLIEKNKIKVSNINILNDYKGEK